MTSILVKRDRLEALRRHIHYLEPSHDETGFADWLIVMEIIGAMLKRKDHEEPPQLPPDEGVCGKCKYETCSERMSGLDVCTLNAWFASKYGHITCLSGSNPPQSATRDTSADAGTVPSVTTASDPCETCSKAMVTCHSMGPWKSCGMYSPKVTVTTTAPHAWQSGMLRVDVENIPELVTLEEVRHRIDVTMADHLCAIDHLSPAEVQQMIRDEFVAHTIGQHERDRKEREGMLVNIDKDGHISPAEIQKMIDATVGRAQESHHGNWHHGIRDGVKAMIADALTVYETRENTLAERVAKLEAVRVVKG